MHSEWIESRVSLSERLAAGECGGSAAEAVLILSSLISGIAADLWPGKGIDQRRFNEVWARYSDPELDATLVSVPLLIGELDRQKSYSASDRLRANNPDAYMPRGFPDSRVVTGEDVDMRDHEIRSVVPDLEVSTTRRWSYGNVFYVHFRSGYVHEYKVGTHADEVVMSTTRSVITYGNFVKAPHRRINFEIGWVASVARSLVERAASDWQGRPLPAPGAWWIDGAG